MTPEIVKEKCICKESFYWNITQPYFQFEKGRIYDVNVRTHTSINISDNVKVYSFEFCDYAVLGPKFKEYFETIEDMRDNKLNQLGI